MLRFLPLALVLALAPLAQAQTGEIVDVRPSREQPILDVADEVVAFIAENRLAVPRSSTAPRAQVRYRVRGERSGDAMALLVRLAETDALRSLSTSGAPDGKTSVDATFTFATVAEWAAWTERPATRALLAELSGARGLRTDLDVNR